jgi:sulfate transport system ATP-binding protein
MAEEFGLLVSVDVTPERYTALKLKPEEVVYISPKKARIFAEDYVI